MPRGDAGATSLISMCWVPQCCMAFPATFPASPACLCIALEQPGSARMAKALEKGILDMKLLSWLARCIFALPWPCLLTQGLSYLPGVNDWGRENKPPPAAPSTIGCLPGWQWPPGGAVAGGSRDRVVAGWVPAAPQVLQLMTSSCPQTPCSAALQPGQTRHLADLG